jgi:hypothetical protein
MAVVPYGIHPNFYYRRAVVLQLVDQILYVRNEIHKCLYIILAINFKDQISTIGFPSRKIKSVLKWWGVTQKSLVLHLTEMKIYVQCNIQGQKLDLRCEINKHIFVFTHQLYRFILVVNNVDLYHFSNNHTFVAK